MSMGEVDNFTDAPIIGKTIQDINEGNSTALIIPMNLLGNCKLKTPKYQCL